MVPFTESNQSREARLAQLVACLTLTQCVGSSPTHGTEHFGFPSGASWLGMSSRVCATGSIKDPVPYHLRKREGDTVYILSPSGQFPDRFIHQVIIITGLNKLPYMIVCFRQEMASDASGHKTSIQNSKLQPKRFIPVL